MYGYIRTYPPELKLREQEYYRAVYCGLCRREGQCTGQCARLMLSYDFAFMAVMRMALTGEKPVMQSRRCAVHPLKKRLMAETQPEPPAYPDALTLCACASAILSYHKVRDDLHDEQGRQRLRAELVTPLVADARRHALCRKKNAPPAPLPSYADMDRAVRDQLHALHELESRRSATVDEPAECFGRLMACVLAWGLEKESPPARLAQEIGLHVGRWVYIVDAADDYEEDVRKGRYNPFACLYGDGAGTLTKTHREEIRAALAREVDGIRQAVDLIEVDDRDLAGIIGNVLDEGMPRVAADVLSDGSTTVGHRKKKTGAAPADQTNKHERD